MQADMPAASAPPSAMTVVLGPGTPITVRLLEPLSTSRSRTGQEFTGELEQPIAAGDLIVAEPGSEVGAVLPKLSARAIFVDSHASRLCLPV